MVDTLAYQADPYPAYARLRERGVHRLTDGRWVVARAADVSQVLHDPAAIVGFTGGGDGVLADTQRLMARFSDGQAHARRRAVAVDGLRTLDPARLRVRARTLTHTYLSGAARVEVMDRIARTVPVAVLAEALGIADRERAVAATRGLCLALAPPQDAAPARDATPARVLRRLIALTAGTPGGAGRHPEPTRGEWVVNTMALLFQAMDATAGLIGNAVVAAHRHGGDDVDRLVAETNRHDPPVQLTTRVAAGPLHLAGHTVPAGHRVVLSLASANRDPDHTRDAERFDPTRRARSLTFGTGPRACPGSAHALSLAAGVLDAFGAAELRLAPQTITYERRPNLRVPTRLVLRREGQPVGSSRPDRN